MENIKLPVKGICETLLSRKNEVEIFDAAGRLLAKCWRVDIANNICKAVNSYDPLLEALRPFANFACDDWHAHDCYNCKAKQAISEAENE